MEVPDQTQVQIEIDPVRGKRARRQSMQHFLWEHAVSLLWATVLPV